MRKGDRKYWVAWALLTGWLLVELYQGLVMRGVL